VQVVPRRAHVGASGVTKRGKHDYAESLDEMKHPDGLIKRILFLDRLPNVPRANSILVCEDVEQIVKADQALEEKALAELRGHHPVRECARFRVL
jgi:bacterioferritin